ncbi:MAG: VOC family protein [Sphingomonadaceae bacterium]|nr:VOC family protein [Sphingomonadaceae bacterium]
MADEFFWYELMTPDQAASEAFYTRVVGWTAAAQNPDGHGNSYVVLSVGDRGVGGLLQLTGEMQAGGARPGWVGYIHVADVDARVQAIVEAGGRQLMPPTEIPGVGRFAMVADPGGAPFYVMNPKPPEGAEPGPMPPTGTPGTIGWRELYSPLGDKGALEFYGAQFGWESVGEFDMGGTMGIYRIFGADGVQMGGMMKQPDNIPASFWNFYINVDAIDAAIERLKEAGGQVMMGPHQVPGGMWIVQGMDPQGAAFALISATK